MERHNNLDGQGDLQSNGAATARELGLDIHRRYGVDPGVTSSTSGFGLGESLLRFASGRLALMEDIQARWRVTNAGQSGVRQLHAWPARRSPFGVTMYGGTSTQAPNVAPSTDPALVVPPFTPPSTFKATEHVTASENQRIRRNSHLAVDAAQSGSGTARDVAMEKLGTHVSSANLIHGDLSQIGAAVPALSSDRPNIADIFKPLAPSRPNVAPTFKPLSLGRPDVIATSKPQSANSPHAAATATPLLPHEPHVIQRRELNEGIASSGTAPGSGNMQPIYSHREEESPAGDSNKFASGVVSRRPIVSSLQPPVTVFVEQPAPIMQPAILSRAARRTSITEGSGLSEGQSSAAERGGSGMDAHTGAIASKSEVTNDMPAGPHPRRGVSMQSDLQVPVELNSYAALQQAGVVGGLEAVPVIYPDLPPGTSTENVSRHKALAAAGSEAVFSNVSTQTSRANQMEAIQRTAMPGSRRDVTRTIIQEQKIDTVFLDASAVPRSSGMTIRRAAQSGSAFADGSTSARSQSNKEEDISRPATAPELSRELESPRAARSTNGDSSSEASQKLVASRRSMVPGVVSTHAESSSLLSPLRQDTSGQMGYTKTEPAPVLPAGGVHLSSPDIRGHRPFVHAPSSTVIEPVLNRRASRPGAEERGWKSSMPSEGVAGGIAHPADQEGAMTPLVLDLRSVTQSEPVLSNEIRQVNISTTSSLAKDSGTASSPIQENRFTSLLEPSPARFFHRSMSGPANLRGKTFRGPERAVFASSRLVKPHQAGAESPVVTIHRNLGAAHGEGVETPLRLPLGASNGSTLIAQDARRDLFNEPHSDRSTHQPGSGYVSMGALPLATFVQRNMSVPAAANGTTSAPPKPTPAMANAVNGTQALPPALNVAQLVNQVYELLVRRLASERQRRGV